MTITKGIISITMDGSFNNDRYKIDKKSEFFFSIIFTISNKFIRWTNIPTKKILIKIYFIFIKNR